MGKKGKKAHRAPQVSLQVSKPEESEILSTRPPMYPHKPAQHSDYLESVLGKVEDDMQPGTFDGAIHLAFVVLIVACIRLVMLNLEQKGFLVEASTIFSCTTIETSKVACIFAIEAICSLPIFCV